MPSSLSLQNKNTKEREGGAQNMKKGTIDWIFKYIKKTGTTLSKGSDIALGGGYRALPKESDTCDPKSVWVHAW
jgi:hypothetical protein